MFLKNQNIKGVGICFWDDERQEYNHLKFVQAFLADQ